MHSRPSPDGAGSQLLPSLFGLASPAGISHLKVPTLSSLPGNFGSTPCCQYWISMVLKTISTFCRTLPSSVADWFTLVMKASVITAVQNGLRSLSPVDLHIWSSILSNDFPVQMELRVMYDDL